MIYFDRCDGTTIHISVDFYDDTLMCVEVIHGGIENKRYCAVQDGEMLIDKLKEQKSTMLRNIDHGYPHLNMGGIYRTLFHNYRHVFLHDKTGRPIQ